MDRRKSSTPHYHTFPTKPPTSRGRPPSSSHNTSAYTHAGDNSHAAGDSHSSGDHHESPLPKKQLIMLAIIALAEQTALNSISPYLPHMASSFPEVGQGEVGLYVGLIASAFALAQFGTNFFWGWLSDRIGRKPVILTGTILTAACFVAFGFCRTLGQAVAVQALMGIVNGNQGVVSTCLGEITDRSNQSRAFTYLPVVYGMGGITGPIVGGLLVYQRNPFNKSKPNPYPYLLPNLLSAGVLVVDFILTLIFLEESLEEARKLPPLRKRMGSLFARLWEFTASSRPSYLRFGSSKRHQKYRASDDSEAVEDESEDTSASDSASETESSALLPIPAARLSKKEVLNRNTMLLLGTYLIFQLSNISYNSLYPIFAQGAPPTGRNLNPEEIGVSLAFAGIVTIVFQVGIFGKLREKMGNKTTYRVGLGGFVVAFVLMPWVGYKDNAGPGFGKGKVWIWVEIGFVLLIKTVAAVGGLTSALLLITNSAPNHSVLGTLNGLAQTLSAAGRAVGPFLSGGLFSLATHVKPKGEALAWGVFGGVALVGFFLSFGIRGNELEAQGWDEESQEEEDDDDDDDNEDDSNARRH
ncbi:MFS transporter [Xylona heveae TC161]|uniref:MFS transporter n=1 Tax=Xylona heveae (strain CBS 132557 / TC161) TaxID=1328760 RepID=A0A165FBN8_XYLHT|nr:MFS transporter [Xylona heveae TC161]KZF20792.1 MFS transporter [Xylona heveae TC161]